MLLREVSRRLEEGLEMAFRTRRSIPVRKDDHTPACVYGVECDFLMLVRFRNENSQG